MEYTENFEEAKKRDQLRSKMLRYILYKKRTEQEVRQKFCEEDENEVEDAIEYFKELHYIDDWNYIERSLQEFINLKNLSIKEISYKLCQKGVNKGLLEDYMGKHEEELLTYEIHSARKIWDKKIANSDEKSIKEFLYRKGYKAETLRKLESEE